MDKLDDGRSVIVTGPAGSGKSGVLRTAARRRRKDGLVYFLDARELSGVSLLGEIPAEYRLQRSIADTLDRLSGEFGRCLFVVDQLDNVRGGTAGKKVREMLRQVNTTDNVQVLCACRAWDIDEGTTYDVLVDSFTRYGLEPLRENVVREVLVDIGVAPEEVSSPLVKLGRNLLNLSLVGEIEQSREDVAFGEIRSAVQLWDAYAESLATREGETSPEYDKGVIDECITYAAEAFRTASESFGVADGKYAERIRSRKAIVPVNPDSGYSQQYFFSRGVARIPLRPEARWCTLHPRDRRR